MADHQPSDLPLGTVLGDKFRITRVVGRGGMAEVYEAVNVDIGKRVAVKVLSASLVTSKVVRERFLREARAAAAIRSPYICDVYDSGVFEERPFLVMELLEGESLYEQLTRVRRLDAETTLRVAVQTCRGLAKAHQAGVIHRDLKPENIFLVTDEEGGTLVKLVDFGLAKFYEAQEGAEQARLTREGALFGTPAYMSPEQARGESQVDQRVDLWALGCIVYECLTGRTVWNVDQGVAMILAQIAAAPLPVPSRMVRDLPQAFDAWFARALHRDAEQRFQSPLEFAESLEQALAPAPARTLIEFGDTDLPPGVENKKLEAPATPSGPEPGLQNTPPRRRPLPLVLGAALLAAVAIVGYSWLNRSSSNLDLPPTETEPDALRISNAQLELSQGRAEAALKELEAALEMAQSPVARSLMQRYDIVAAQAKEPAQPCTVTGLGRPRPFGRSNESSRPTAALSTEGLVVGWAEAPAAPMRQAQAVLLDSALRRVTTPSLIAPEAPTLRDPLLLSAGGRLQALWVDRNESKGGVFLRSIDVHRNQHGPALSLASTRPTSAPRATATAAGGLFVVWEEAAWHGGVTISGLELGRNLEPRGPALRLATLTPRLRRGNTRGTARPVVAVTKTELRIIFGLELTPQRNRLMQLVIPLGDPRLNTGLGPLPTSDPKDGLQPEDEFLGRLLEVSALDQRHSDPQLACRPEGTCFVAWDRGTAGATIAVLANPGNVAWAREFASAGARPTFGESAHQTVLAWLEESRLKLASLDHKGPGPASTLTRVTGFQPHPTVIAGESAGLWYIAWRDFEAGHPESFVLKAQCR